MKENFRNFTFAVILISCWGTIGNAQSSDNDRSSRVMRQTPEARESVLQKARAAGNKIEVAVELPVPLTAGVVENVALDGELQSVVIVSTDSDWQVTLYSTPESPITSLSLALENAQQLYRDLNVRSTVAVRSFTFRGAPLEAMRARDVLPNAELALVTDLAEVAKLDDVRPPAPVEEKKAAAKKMQQLPMEAATADEAFHPNNVELKIQTLSNKERRIDITFSWNGASDLSALMKDRATFEIQVLFWNHAKKPKDNNTTYVGRIKSVTTNFNTADHTYVDTQALNGLGIAGKPEEREVAVGSFKAQTDFTAGKQYKVSVITEPGALDANLAKLSFQRGIYEPTISEGLEVQLYCAERRLRGDNNPANCVKGKSTFVVTPKNAINSSYSILAPTVPSFKYPTMTCQTPVGFPQLNKGKGLDTIDEAAAKQLAARALLFQKTFERNGKNKVGCPANSVHTDTSWWPSGGTTQDFEGGSAGKGAIMLAQGGSQAFWLHGGIWSRYASLGGPRSALSEPTGEELPVTSSRKTKGAYQAFRSGWLYYHQPKNRVFYVVNAIAQKYKSVGMHVDQLGFPISDEYSFQGGARNDFEGGYIHWTAAKGAVIVRSSSSGPAKPTLESYTLNKSPRANEPFDGTVKATGLVTNSTKLWFCLSGTKTCYPHPQNGVTVKSSVQLTFKNVRLSSGSWEMFLETPNGQTAHSKRFAVLPGPPVIAFYKWTSTPKANKNFSGYIEATDLIANKTEVLFCIKGKSTCYPHPKSGITVVNATRVNVKNVRLDRNKWQIKLRTPWGQSNLSSAFTTK